MTGLVHAGPAVGAADLPANRLRSVVDNLKDVVFQADAAGRWTFLNRAWEETTGFSVEESLGVVYLEFLHPSDRDNSQEKFRQLLDGKQDCCRHEVRHLTKAGGFRWMEVHARLTMSETGQITGVAGTLSDVTERRKANDELRGARQRLDHVLAANPAVTFAGRPGRNTPWAITFISPNVEEILGFSPEMFTSTPHFWMTTIHPDDLKGAYQSLVLLETVGRSTVRYRSRRKDGSYCWLRADMRVLTDPTGQPQEVFGCLVDESQTYKMEESLRSHAAILSAVCFAAQRFLDASSWRKEVDNLLRRLGEATGASRVYIVENVSGAGRDTLTTLRYEWDSEGVPRLLGKPGLADVSYRDMGVAQWVAALGRGEPIHGRVRDFPASMQAKLPPLGALSLLLAPIFTGRDWWGFIGFDDCLDDREWSVAEIDAVRTAAGILGAAIKRDQTKSELRHNRALLKTVTDASPLGVYVVDNRLDKILYVNDRFCEIWGVSHLVDGLRRGEITAKDLVVHCVPFVEDPAVFAAPRAPLSDESNRSVATDHIRLRDGRTIERISTQIRDAAGAYLGRLYLFEDVTEQKNTEAALLRTLSELEIRVAGRTADLNQLNERLRAEIAERQAAQQALAEREARFRTVTENASDMILIIDAHAIIEYVSPAVTRILGYHPDELVGRAGVEFVDPNDVSRALARFQQALDPNDTPSLVEFRARHKDGSTRLVEAIGSNQLDNPAVRGLVVTLRDITDRRRLEYQFREAQRMEAVGRLAGGVAHDFNNLLTVICGYSELLAKRLIEGDPLRRNVELIQRAGVRASGLVRQLLTFSQTQAVQPAILDVNEAILGIESMLRCLIGEDVDLTIVPCAEPLYVYIDQTHLTQIVMNLSVNARDAMPNGGALSILAGVQARGHACPCKDGTSAPKDFAVLTVRDSGAGMSEEIKGRVFDPFFTTKEVGKGSGLGLSMVYGAVQQAGGYIQLDTELGLGTTLRICLPRVEKPAPNRVDAAVPGAKGGNETILVAEDDAPVRGMISGALRNAGYKVLESPRGEHALEVARQHKSSIHLLLTDVVMPRMSGPDLALRLAAVGPDTKVLYMSGYSGRALPPGCDLIKKPFSGEELTRAVRAALERSAPG